MFKCECGKEFENPQSFNGHKSHCKEHYLAKYGNLDAFQKQLARQASASRLASEASHKKSELFHKNKKMELEIWLASEPTCEKCRKIMTEKYGSGRFCSRACANSREHSEETKQKIHNTLNQTLNYCIQDKKFCKVCGKLIKSYNKSGFCAYCLANTPEGKQAKKEAGQRGYQTMVVNGTHKGWQSRNITSYAEKFWISVLENNNIFYEREFPIQHGTSNYFLDFRLECDGKLIDLEIDGKQHTYTDRIDHDKSRDKYLQNLGYIVYRISWNDLKTDAGKQEMQEKIDKFLDFYNAL